ncbi:MAG: 23S rRNA (pseudouridine(1915)-N(3))-methyltransferase RlmH [Chitinophagales bacterium]
MKITLLSVGKTADKHLAYMIDVYTARIKKYTAFYSKELTEIKNAGALSRKETQEKESAIISAYIAPADTVVLLDEKGKTYTSVSFATFIMQKQVSSTKHLIFVVGGAYGFDSAFKKKYPESLSLSTMTFTHQMVRLIFCEQLYRAFTILNNEPYHHP